MYLLDADLKAEMRREGIVPDTWVWPARMATYLHMVPEEEGKFFPILFCSSRYFFVLGLTFTTVTKFFYSV